MACTPLEQSRVSGILVGQIESGATVKAGEGLIVTPWRAE
jgi:hypothetical protein